MHGSRRCNDYQTNYLHLHPDIRWIFILFPHPKIRLVGRRCSRVDIPNGFISDASVEEISERT